MKIITRRRFIKDVTAAGVAASMIGPAGLAEAVAKELARPVKPGDLDLAVVQGLDYYANTVIAVERLGGMKRFVSKGAKTAILANCEWRNHGASVHPSILLALVSMCYEAGAAEVTLLKHPSSRYWKKSPEYEGRKEILSSLRLPKDEYKSFYIKEGRKLKTALVITDLFRADVFINVSIAKHHDGVHFSGVLKNTMGISKYEPTLKYFHFGGKPSSGLGWYKDADHLSQCIADINLIRSPELCVADATEFITTSGPSGPGRLKKPQQIIAGVDGVLVDSYGSSLHDAKRSKYIFLDKAVQNGLGSADLDQSRIEKLRNDKQ